MSLAFFDTSALVRLVLSEPGFELVGRCWLASDRPVCARVAYVEAHAAIQSAHRQRRLDGHRVISVTRRLDALWEQADIIEAGEALIRAAAHLVRRHPLKAYDAVHVAAALTAGASVFVTGDRSQASAAAAEAVEAIIV